MINKHVFRHQILEVWLALLTLFVAVWYWQDNLRSREVTLKYCRRVCEANNVQFLDQTVHVAHFRFGRTAEGRFCIRRFYAFEFSVRGADRQHGVAVVANGKVEYLSLLHPDGEIIEGNLPT